MKKLIALIIAGLMVLSFAACGGNTEETTAAEETTVADLTVAGMYAAEFKTLAADTTLSAEDIANKLFENVENPIASLGVMPVEEGLNAGFENFEIKGFSEGAVLQNMMMGGAAFIAYVFELAEDTDVDAFTTGLKDNANLRWNVCTAAEEMLVETEGNKVFFIMAPLAFEEAPAEEGGEVEGDVVEGGEVGGMEVGGEGPAAYDPEAETAEEAAEETTATEEFVEETTAE